MPTIGPRILDAKSGERVYLIDGPLVAEAARSADGEPWKAIVRHILHGLVAAASGSTWQEACELALAQAKGGNSA
jgi:hypothetical protein